MPRNICGHPVLRVPAPSRHTCFAASRWGALRVRRYRERRREGLRLLTLEIPEPVIEAAIARGLLKPEDCAQSSSVMRSAFATQLSDTALNWLTSNAVITSEQRADAVAILQRISAASSSAITRGTRSPTSISRKSRGGDRRRTAHPATRPGASPPTSPSCRSCCRERLRRLLRASWLSP